MFGIKTVEQEGDSRKWHNYDVCFLINSPWMENKLQYQANSQELEMISKRKNFQFILSIENYRIKNKKK